MNMTLSRFMVRDIFLPAGKCLYFFTFPNIRICLLQNTKQTDPFYFVKIYDTWTVTE